MYDFRNVVITCNFISNDHYVLAIGHVNKIVGGRRDASHLIFSNNRIIDIYSLKQRAIQAINVVL